MRQWAFLAVVLMLTAIVSAQDWEGDLVGAEATGDLHGMVGVTWDSEYVWRGFKVFGSKSTTHVMGDLNLWDTGFGISATGHYPNGSGSSEWISSYTNYVRWDYSLYYQNALFAGEQYATNYRVGWVLYDYPDMPSIQADLQEGHAVLSWPNLLPVQGLCPSYAIVKTWPSESNSYIGSASPRGGSASGWYHIFMLDYGFTVEGVIPQIPEHLIRLHGEVVYNDGTNPYGRVMDHGWSHALFGVSTDVDLGSNLRLTPSVYYQMNLERGLKEWNDGSDDLWASIGLQYAF